MDKVVTSRHRPERNRERKNVKWNNEIGFKSPTVHSTLTLSQRVWSEIQNTFGRILHCCFVVFFHEWKNPQHNFLIQNPSFRTLSFQLRIWHEKLYCRFFHSWKNTTKQLKSMRSKVFRISQQKNVLQCKIINSDQTLILFPDQTLQL